YPLPPPFPYTTLFRSSPADGKVLGQAKLAGHPESFQLERSGSRVFVNVPAAEHVAVVDRATMKVVATWPVADAKSNFPMALDERSEEHTSELQSRFDL